jgi:hypothetical protein
MAALLPGRGRGPGRGLPGRGRGLPGRGRGPPPPPPGGWDEIGNKRRNVYCNSNYYNIAFSDTNYPGNPSVGRTGTNSYYAHFNNPNYIYSFVQRVFQFAPTYHKLPVVYALDLFGDGIVHEVILHYRATNTGIYITLSTDITDPITGHSNLPYDWGGVPLIYQYTGIIGAPLVPIMHFSYHYTEQADIKPMTEGINFNFVNGCAHVKLNPEFVIFMERDKYHGFTPLDPGNPRVHTPYVPIIFSQQTGSFLTSGQIRFGQDSYLSRRELAQNNGCGAGYNQRTPNDLLYYFTGPNGVVSPNDIHALDIYRLFWPLFCILYDSGVNAMNGFVANPIYNPVTINTAIARQFPESYDIIECSPNNCGPGGGALQAQLPGGVFDPAFLFFHVLINSAPFPVVNNAPVPTGAVPGGSRKRQLGNNQSKKKKKRRSRKIQRNKTKRKYN